MFVIPLQLNATEYNVFICLQDDNIERMRAYDPAEVVTAKFGPAFNALRLRDVIIGYGTRADMEHVVNLINRDGNPNEALRFLSRGFAFRPKDGDHDGPYLSAKRGNENPQ